jgi:integrase
MEVPRELRPRLGKRRLVKSLGTRDIGEARRLRHPVIAEWLALFQEGREGLTDQDRMAAGDLAAEARQWRRDIEAAPGRLADDLSSLASDRAERIERERGREAAQAFARVAHGEATTLSDKLDPWLAESGGTDKTKLQHRKAVAELLAWAGGEVTLEGFGRRQAGEFVSKRLLRAGLAPKTVNRYLSSLSMLWKWLAKRGHLGDASANPWQGQAQPVKGRRGARVEPERPFTDAEVAKLLAGPADARKARDPLLADLMPMAALSGMRIEELCRLTVADCAARSGEPCAGGSFVIREGKTDAAARTVPIHPALAPVVARRCAGKGPSGFLFHELPGNGLDGKRSDPASKRFTRYRRAAGVDEARDGKRRSLVNFHSFRKWFVTKAEQAGVPGETIKIVVGHKRQDVTFGVYSGGPSEQQKRACVEAIKLPDGTVIA